MIPFEHLNHLLDWTAWDKLNQSKGHQQNAKQRGHHQQKTLGHVDPNG
jgi:hypothetical protein